MNDSNIQKLNYRSRNRQKPRTDRIDIRINEDERALLKAQADFYGMDISSYIRFLVSLDAQRISQAEPHSNYGL